MVKRDQLGADERGETYVVELAVDDEFLASWSTHGSYSGQLTFARSRVAVETLLGWSCWRVRRRLRSRLRAEHRASSCSGWLRSETSQRCLTRCEQRDGCF